MCVRLRCPGPVAQWQQAGNYPPGEAVIPLQALAGLEGRADVPVVLEATPDGKVQAQWNDGGVPQIASYDQTDTRTLPAFPELPQVMAAMPSNLLAALAEACQAASTDNARYALSNLQLKGSAQSIVATDGKQLLVQKGWTFPWTDDLLVPASPVFACKELLHGDSVEIGKTDTYVALRSGAWAVYLPIDKDGRFPPTDQIIPRRADAVSQCRLDPQDQEFLAKALLHLPRPDSDEPAVITMDLNGQVCLRARAADKKQTVELVLSRSSATRAMCMVMDRAHLARALRLGLTEFFVRGPDKPVLFQDAQRTFVTMPYGHDAAVPASENAIRIQSTSHAQDPIPQPRTTAVNSTNDQSTLNPNGTNDQPVPATTPQTRPVVKIRKSKSTGLSAIIVEAEAVKDACREILARSHSLVATLKRQRRQSRLMQTSLKALKAMQIGE
jgi:hypothetical protein